MAEEKKYYIRVPESLVEVSKDIYLAYYQEKRYSRTLEEKDQRNGKTSYDDLDTSEMSGIEMIPDPNTISVEDTAVAHILRDKLHHCLALLPDSDKQLIFALYFEGLSERKLSDKIGVHHMTIHSRKMAILRTLKKMMK